MTEHVRGGASHFRKLGLREYISFSTGFLILLIYLLTTNWEGPPIDPLSYKVAGTSAVHFQFQDTTYDAYEVDLSVVQIDAFLHNPQGEHFENFSQLHGYLNSQQRHLVFAMNAGMFNPDLDPVGLYIQNGETHFSLNLDSGEGNFFLKPNGVFQIAGKQGSIHRSSEWQPNNQIRLATQSGPLLLHRGKVHPALSMASKSLHIRNGVGILPNGKVVFVISNQRVNFFDFAMVFKDYLHCRDALYLDGGISKMYLPELKRLEMDGQLGPMLALSVPL